jgi:hypothetical protein
MAHNRYYIVDANDVNLDEILNVSVGDIEEQRFNNDKTLLIIKLCEGDHEDYPFLAQYIEYDHDQIIEKLKESEWQTPF